MKLRDIIVADVILEAGSGKVNILGAGVTTITPSELPARQQDLAALFRLEIEKADYNRAAQMLTVRLLEPDGSTLGSVKVGIEPADIAEGRTTMPEENQVMNFTWRLSGVPLPRAGVYRFVVELDERKLGSQAFLVAEPAG
jgi:hypothetical protein